MIAKSDLTILTLASAAVVMAVMKLGPPATPANAIVTTGGPIQTTVEPATGNQPATVPTTLVESDPVDGTSMETTVVSAEPVPSGGSETMASTIDPTVTQFPDPAAEVFSTHVVRSGESLSVIARRYDTTVNDLMSLNNLNNYTIFVGQELIYRTN